MFSTSGNNNNNSNSNNNNNNNNNSKLKVSQIDSPNPTLGLSGTDYENIGIMYDAKKFDNKTGNVRSNHNPLPNMIGLPLGTGGYPVFLTTSQSSKSLPVFPGQELSHLKMNTSPSFSSSIYQKPAMLVHSSSPSSSTISSIHTLPKSEILRPKSTTNESILFESSLLSSKGSNLANSRSSFDHLHSPPHFENVMLSRSELSLTNKSCYPAMNVASVNPKNLNVTLNVAPINQSTRSQAHHFAKLDETKCFTPLTLSTSTHTLNRNHNQSEVKPSAASVPPSSSSSSSSSIEWNNTWSSTSSKRIHDDTNKVGNISPSGTLLSTLSISMKDLYRNRNLSIYKPTPTYPSQQRSSSVTERLKIRSGSSYKGSGGNCSSTSTLQEDLLKIINLDYKDKSNTGDIESNSNTSGNETSTSHYSTPYSSLERSSNKSGARHKNLEKTSPWASGQSSQSNNFSQHSSPEHNYSKDEPASHLTRSQTTPALSSILSTKLTSTKEEELGSGDEEVVGEANLLTSKDDVNLDWPTLVETATKAIAKASEIDENEDINAIDEWLKEFGANISTNGIAGVGCENVKVLEETVKKLQFDLVKEQSDKASLEEQVKSLKEENIRLLEESKTAAAQLRKFTEWFFQNINAR